MEGKNVVDVHVGEKVNAERNEAKDKPVLFDTHTFMISSIYWKLVCYACR